MPQKKAVPSACVSANHNVDLTFLCQNFSLFFPPHLLCLSIRTFHRGCHAFPYSACPPPLDVVVFLRLMRLGCFSCCCVCVFEMPSPSSFAGACFSSSGWSWTRTAELVTSGSPLSAGEALWWTPEWWFPQRRTRTKLSWGLVGCVWPVLLMPDNKQTQQFSWVSHAWWDRKWCEPQKEEPWICW